MGRLFNARVVRFLLCGGGAAAVNWLARIALSLVMPFGAAVAAAYGIGMAVGFVLYRTVVWKTSGAPWRPQALRFLAVNAYGALIVLIVSLGLVELGKLLFADLRVLEAIAHALAIVAGAVANYSGHSRYTFRARPLERVENCRT